MNAARRTLRWAAPMAVLGLAAVLRLWALASPNLLVFDELYYVRDAVSQLAHGTPTVWPDDEAAFGGERARAFGDDPSTIAHPPLGKWLIGLGIALLGADTGWGWRIAVAIAGVATVGLTMLLGRMMTGSVWVATLAGFVLAVDGVHIVLSRVALLDGLLTLFVLVGALFIWCDQRRGTHDVRGSRGARGSRDSRGSPPRSHLSPRALLWRRPWLIAAGLAFGAATAVKWSGLYPLAAFLLVIALRDLLQRWRMMPRHRWAATGRAALQALITAALALPAAALAYLASWAGWLMNPGAQFREPGEPWWVSLWQWHAHTLAWHSTLTAEHPYQAHPITWPLALRPTLMHWQNTDGGGVSTINALPNPLVTWCGVLALALLGWVLIRSLIRRSAFTSPPERHALWIAAFVLTGALSGWLPWLLTVGRSAVFQFYAVVLTPFTALALALVLAAIAAMPRAPQYARFAGIRLSTHADAVRGRRIAIAIWVSAALALAVLFWPLWSGMPVADWFWRAHLWLPGW